MIWDKKRPKITWVEVFKRDESVWEGKKLKTIEKDRGEMKKNRTEPLYRKVINLNRSRGVERCLDLKCVKKLLKSCLGSVERCPQLEDLDGSRSYQASRKFLNGLSSYQGAIENTIKSSWRGSLDSLAVEMCPVVVEIA